jgi:hypothetical protein
MAKICGIAALVVFALSVFAHITTFVPSIPISMQVAGPIHLAAMAVFAAMIFSLTALQKREPRKPAEGLFAKWIEASQQNKDFQIKLFTCAPLPLSILCASIFMYVMIIFILSSGLMEGGAPAITDGRSVLQNHGKKIRDVSKEEYQRFQAYEVRRFSGLWMIFSIIPAVYFLIVHPKLLEPTEPEAETTKAGSNAPK